MIANASMFANASTFSNASTFVNVSMLAVETHVELNTLKYYRGYRGPKMAFRNSYLLPYSRYLDFT